MKLNILPLLALLALSITTQVTAKKFTEAELTKMAQQFVEAKNARQQPNTTEHDIDNFIALLNDNFIDEHIKFGVTVTDKKKLREGMIAKMKDKVIYSSIEISDVMVGNNVVFVKMVEKGKVVPSHLNKEIEYQTTNVLSLEYDDNGLIKHIRRHHGG